MKYPNENIRLSYKVPKVPVEIYRKCNEKCGVIESGEMVVDGNCLETYVKFQMNDVIKIKRINYNDRGELLGEIVEEICGDISSLYETIIARTGDEEIETYIDHNTGEKSDTLTRYDDVGRAIYYKDDDMEILYSYHDMNDAVLIVSKTFQDDNWIEENKEIKYRNGLPIYSKNSSEEVWWNYTEMSDGTYCVREQDSDGSIHDYRIDSKDCLREFLMGKYLLKPIDNSTTYLKHGCYETFLENGLKLKSVNGDLVYSYEYDSDGRLLNSKGFLENVTYRYDSIGRLIEKIVENNTIETIDYIEKDNFMRVFRVTRQADKVTTETSMYEFDDNGNVIHQMDSDGYEGWIEYRY